MVDAHDRWDSTRVLSLGEKAESDLAIIDFPLKEKVEIELLEMMARASLSIHCIIIYKVYKFIRIYKNLYIV
jgi:hypothetical protein